MDQIPDSAWVERLPEEARSSLPPAVWKYVSSGSYAGLTAAEAEVAWRAIRLWPRALREVGEVSLATTLLGTALASPIAIAPTAMQRAVHPEGELAMARGAGAAGTLHVVSANAGHQWADIGRTGAPWWLQVYLPPERERFLPVLEAAVQAGAGAVVLTVDTPFPGPKPPSADSEWTGIDLSWWRCNFADPEAPAWADDLGPADLVWLREHSGVPVVAKGVLRADDARRCVEAGAAAVWVSNHGGRQLDRAVSTAQALSGVVAAVGERTEVYVDGGIRSGLDVLSALALGARAAFVGRPALYALACSGAPGVLRLLHALETELGDGLALAGCAEPLQAADLREQPL